MKKANWFNNNIWPIGILALAFMAPLTHAASISHVDCISGICNDPPATSTLQVDIESPDGTVLSPVNNMLDLLSDRSASGNTPPEITFTAGSETEMMNPGETFSWQLNITDNGPADELDYYFVPPYALGFLDDSDIENGNFSYTAPNNFVGQLSIAVIVFDKERLYDKKIINLDVIGTPSSPAPSVPDTNLTTDFDTNITDFSFGGVGPNTFVHVSQDASLRRGNVIGSNESWTFYPDPDQFGSTIFVIERYNNDGQSAFAFLEITINEPLVTHELRAHSQSGPIIGSGSGYGDPQIPLTLDGLQGDTEIFIESTDEGGGSASDSGSFFIDSFPPTIVLINPPDTSVCYTNTIPAVNGTARDEETFIRGVEFSAPPLFNATDLGDTDLSNSDYDFSLPSQDVTGIEHGLLSFTFIARDGGSNEDSVQINFNIDNRHPDISAIQLDNNIDIDPNDIPTDPIDVQDNMPFRINAVDVGCADMGSISVTIDDETTGLEITNNTPHQISGNIRAQNLTPGGHDLKITVTDANNNSVTLLPIRLNVVSGTNLPPVADAGEDFTIQEGFQITLDGSGSDDPGGHRGGLRYQWTQLSGPVLSPITSLDIVNPTFSPKPVGTDTTIVFELTVFDEHGLESLTPDTVQITIEDVNGNEPPISNAGSDQSVPEDSDVFLDGTLSEDPDGIDNDLNFSWIQTDGPTVTLSDSQIPNPTFRSPFVGGPTSITFELTVTDSNGTESLEADTVTISIEDRDGNRPPVADAGPDHTSVENSNVELNGTQSNDPDGDNLKLDYSWTQVSGPTAVITDPTSRNPILTTPYVGGTTILEFDLMVTDEYDLQSLTADRVVITVTDTDGNRPPIADAGDDKTELENTDSTLYGTRSTDPDGDNSQLNYSWTQIRGPEVTLSDSTDDTPTFRVPFVGDNSVELEFELMVSDQFDLDSDTADRVVISIMDTDGNRPPIADAGPDESIAENNSYQLDGSGSSDSDGDDSRLTYSWTQVNGPTVQMDDPTRVNPSFNTPPVGGNTPLEFDLIVRDELTLVSDTSDRVIITVTDTDGNRPPVANAGADQSKNENDVVTLDGSLSSDEDGDDGQISFTWTQMDGPTVSLSNNSARNPTFTAPQVGGETIIRFSLMVTDQFSLDADAPDEVVITISDTDGNLPPIPNAGPDQTVDEETTVTLNALLSNDPDGDNGQLQYNWTKVAGPGINFSQNDGHNASFYVPDLGASTIFQFDLLVIDQWGTMSTNSDRVQITINNLDGNDRPIADAGDNIQVDENTMDVQLDGSRSSDPDGSGAPLIYSWAQVSGPSITLSNPAAEKPTIDIPFVGDDSIIEIDLVVIDEFNLPSENPSRLTITINDTDGNRPPVAQAGNDQAGDENTNVQLDGSQSSDSDGDESKLDYTWTQVNGPPATISDAHIVNPIITLPFVGESTTIEFDLMVTDEFGLDALTADRVVITINDTNGNQPPLAHAGNDFSGDENTVVALDGSQSSDIDGNEARMQFTWTQISGPTAGIDNHELMTPQITLPFVGANTTIEFDLMVTDELNLDALTSDRVVITVNDVDGNLSPIANAGDDSDIDENNLYQLDGNGSSDPDGENNLLDYSWVQVSGPSVSLSNPTLVNPTFTAPFVGQSVDIEFQMTVTDGIDNDIDNVSITINDVDGNRAPVAHAGEDQTLDENLPVQLDASHSSDSDGDNSLLTYFWSQIQGPTVTLTNPDSATPSFIAPDVGGQTSLVFELMVRDQFNLLSDTPDSVAIVVRDLTGNKRPVANAGPDQTINEDTTNVQLDASGSSDPDGDFSDLQFTWTQIEGPLVQLSNSNIHNPTFTAPAVGATTDIRFQLTVHDVFDLESLFPDTVRITINDTNGNRPPVAIAGPGFSANENSEVNLNGDASYDPDGNDENLDYLWSQISGPIVFIHENTESNAHFTAPIVDTAVALTFRLFVRDELNVTSQASLVTVTINDLGDLDTVAPVIQSLEPLNSAIINGIEPVIVDATDETMMRHVQIYIRNLGDPVPPIETPVATLPGPDSPYTWNWNTELLNTYPDGNYELKVIAVDLGNNTDTESHFITIKNENENPAIVEIKEPNPNTYLKESVTLRAEVSGIDLIKTDINKVEFFINNQLMPVENIIEPVNIPGDYTYEWHTHLDNTLEDGLKTLRVRVETQSGRITEAVRSFYVDNSPPTLEYISPDPDDGTPIFFGNQNIRVRAEDNLAMGSVIFKIRQTTLRNFRLEDDGFILLEIDTTLIPDDVYILDAFPIDLAGNMRPEAYQLEFQINNTNPPETRAEISIHPANQGFTVTEEESEVFIEFLDLPPDTVSIEDDTIQLFCTTNGVERRIEGRSVYYSTEGRRLVFEPMNDAIPFNSDCEWSLNDLRDANGAAITGRFTFSRAMPKVSGGEVIMNANEGTSDFRVVIPENCLTEDMMVRIDHIDREELNNRGIDPGAFADSLDAEIVDGPFDTYGQIPTGTPGEWQDVHNLACAAQMIYTKHTPATGRDLGRLNDIQTWIDGRWTRLGTNTNPTTQNNPGSVISVSVNKFALFQITAFSLPAGGVDGFIAYPNPFSPFQLNLKNENGILLQYSLWANANVKVIIYDIFGNFVRQMEFPAGNINGGRIALNQVSWDGKNGNGNVVGNGSYIIQVVARDESGNEASARVKVAVVK